MSSVPPLESYLDRGAITFEGLSRACVGCGGLWYIRKQNEAEDVDVARPYLAALSILLSAIPEHRQDAARADAVAFLRSLHGAHGPIPGGWKCSTRPRCIRSQKAHTVTPDGEGMMEDEVENAWAALTVLAGYLPGDREEVRRRVAEAFLRGFAELGVDPPEWTEQRIDAGARWAPASSPPGVPGRWMRGRIPQAWSGNSPVEEEPEVLRDPQRVQADESVSVRAQRILGEDFMTLWGDPAVRELYVNSDGQVWANRSGVGRQRAGLVLDEVAVLKFLGAVAAYRKETLTPEKPSLQAAMPEARFHGARLQGYVPPRAPGPGFNLRKHAAEVPPLESYLDRGAITFEGFDLLLESIDRRRNILVAGGTASGKTTFLCALIATIAERWPAHRLLIVEDTPEIQCSAPDFVSYRTLPGEKMGPVINREAMRLTPDRIICGEFRDRAAYYCADLWITGHNGGAASMHADTVEGALERMDLLMLDGRKGSYAKLIVRAVDLVVVLERGKVGGQVADLALVDGLDPRGRFRVRRPRAGAKP